MTANAVAFFLREPESISGAGATWPHGEAGLYPEEPPVILWGQGTPDGDRQPFLGANKGSLYISTNQTDDTLVLWQKIDEGGDDADWVQVVDTGGTNVQVDQWGSLIDISVSAVEQVVFHAVAEILITEIGLVWNEATGASVGGPGTIDIGVTSGGEEIVAEVAYDVSQASGDYQGLTIADGQVTAGQSVFVAHSTQAASANGTCFVVAKYTIV